MCLISSIGLGRLSNSERRRGRVAGRLSATGSALRQPVPDTPPTHGSLWLRRRPDGATVKDTNMKTGKTLTRLPLLLGPMALALTFLASSPSYAYDDGACAPSCTCPQDEYDSTCAYDSPYGFYPYGFDDYGSDWSYGSWRHEGNHRSYGYDHGGSA